GKSTLVKTLSGVTRPDSGQILIEGNPVHLTSPLNAREHGIETVYQDLALAPDLDAAANLHLGREIYRWWPPLHVLNKTEMRRRAIAAFADLGVELPDVGAPVGTLSGGQRQSVAVARAVSYASRIIFASLSELPGWAHGRAGDRCRVGGAHWRASGWGTGIHAGTRHTGGGVA